MDKTYNKKIQNKLIVVIAKTKKMQKRQLRHRNRGIIEIKDPDKGDEDLVTRISIDIADIYRKVNSPGIEIEGATSNDNNNRQ